VLTGGSCGRATRWWRGRSLGRGVPRRRIRRRSATTHHGAGRIERGRGRGRQQGKLSRRLRILRQWRLMLLLLLVVVFDLAESENSRRCPRTPKARRGRLAMCQKDDRPDAHGGELPGPARLAYSRSLSSQRHAAASPSLNRSKLCMARRVIV
jgi:hypothetical protein